MAPWYGALGFRLMAKTHHPRLGGLPSLPLLRPHLAQWSCSVWQSCCVHLGGCNHLRTWSWPRSRGCEEKVSKDNFRDCGAGDLPRDVRTVRKVSKERFSRMWSSRPSHWDWVRQIPLGQQIIATPFKIYFTNTDVSTSRFLSFLSYGIYLAWVPCFIFSVLYICN